MFLSRQILYCSELPLFLFYFVLFCSSSATRLKRFPGAEKGRTIWFEKGG